MHSLPQPAEAQGTERAADFRPAWVEISRAALETNLEALQRLLRPHTRLMAVVKANAYGHGLHEIVPLIARNPHVQWLGTALFSEALDLREQGVVLPILVLGHTPSYSWAAAARHRIALTIHDDDQIAALEHFAGTAAPDTRLSVHIKVETGMHRLGIGHRSIPALLQRLVPLAPCVDVEGLFTHFHSAPAKDPLATQHQLQIFSHLLQDLEAGGLRPPLCHCANSAAALYLPETHLDMVRAGGALYGLNPDSQTCRLPAPFGAVLTWRAHVVQIRHLVAGMGLGYDHAFIAPRRTTVAVLPVGYGDGLQWANSGQRRILIGGHAVPVVGRVCMDQSFIDVTALGPDRIRVGDTATLIGAEDGHALWCDDAARQEGTIEYDVTCRISPRIPRVVV